MEAKTDKKPEHSSSILADLVSNQPGIVKECRLGVVKSASKRGFAPIDAIVAAAAAEEAVEKRVR